MNILVIGECYSENLGDAILCETVKKIIDENLKFVHVTLFDISGRENYGSYFQPDEKELKKLYNIRIVNKIAFLQKSNIFYGLYKSDECRYSRTMLLFDKIFQNNNFDMAVFAGGAMFMDYFAGLIYYIVRKLNRAHIKTIFHACGMGTLSVSSVKLLRKVFQYPCVKSISVRDSFQRFSRLFDTNADLSETYDTALACSDYYQASEKKIADIGIGVMSIPQYYDAQKNLVKLFLNSDYSWKIFTNGSLWDEKVAVQILKELEVPSSKIAEYLMPRPMKAGELIKNITSFQRIISYRMHSQIVAASYAISSYAFCWDHKVVELYKKLDLSKHCYKPDYLFDDLLCFEKEKMDESFLKKKVQVAAYQSKKDLLDKINKFI